MNKVFLIFCAALLPLSGLAQDDRSYKTVGMLSCDDSRLVRGKSCKLRWKIAGASSDFRWLQTFDPAYRAWVDVEQLRQAAGMTNTQVAGGKLYRVLTCNDENRQSTCTSSSAIWAPIVPLSESEIPATVQDSNGRMSVSKNDDFEGQVLQYNVYELVRTLNKVDMEAMPPMTEPPTPEKPTLLSDLLYNVHHNYKEMQSFARAAKDSSQ